MQMALRMNSKELDDLLEQNSSSGSHRTRKKSEELSICRVCLQSNTKLFDLLQLSVKDGFSRFTETPVSPAEGIPHYICYYCLALLCKSLCFKIKCQRAYDFLQNVCANDLVTPDVIQNEARSQLSLHLALTPIEMIDLPPDNTPEQIEPVTVDVKVETDSDNHDENQDDYEEYQDSIVMDFEPINSIQSEIKNEDCVAEELKVFKEKDTLRRSGRKNKSDKVKKEKPPPKKRTRRYNEKFEEDFVAFAKMYNVEVIFLTKEQQLEKARKEKFNLDAKNYPFICDTCYKGFKSQNAYKKHVVLHELNRGNHVCDVCKIRFHTRKRMQVHARIHKIEFVCKICHQVNKSSFTARVHHIFHEGQKFECKYCNKKFNAQSTKLNHVREIHKTLTCDICQKSVSGTIALSTHKKTVHSDTTLQCTKCGVQFQNGVALKRHKCDASLLFCAVCGASYNTSEDVTAHIAEKHQNTVFKCTMCPATFTTDRGLGIHWNRGHLQIWPEKKERKRDSASAAAAGATESAASSYMCEVCAKSYTTAVGLRYHQRIHTGEKPFQCTVCQRKFRLQVQLKIHMNTHTGERPYKCKLCPEAFKSYAQSHKHKLLVHTKERPYKCHLCEKTYVVSYDLKTHIRHSHMHVPRPPRPNRNKLCFK